MTEHWSFSVNLVSDDGNIGPLMVEVGTGEEALEIVRFCERHGICTLIQPWVWYSNDED